MVAPGLERDLAEARVASLRRRLLTSEGGHPGLQFSVGIATLGAGGRPEEALRAADELMYAAKPGRASTASERDFESRGLNAPREAPPAK